MGRPTGLEPATSGITSRRSNQLNYGRREVPRVSEARLAPQGHIPNVAGVGSIAAATVHDGIDAAAPVELIDR